MKRLTLNLKLLFGGIGLVLIPTLMIGFYALHNTTDALRDASNSELLAVAKGAADMVDVAMNAEIAMVREIASGKTLVEVASQVSRSGSASELNDVGGLSQRLVNTMKQVGSQYESIIVVDPNGVIYADGAGGSYKGISIADREYFQIAKAGKANVGQVIKSKKTGNPVAPVASPVLGSSGEVVGVAAVVVKTDALIERIAGTKVGKTGYTFMVDKDGTAIAHPKKDLILSANIQKLKGMESITEKILGGQQGVESYRFQEADKTGGFAPVPTAQWRVITTLDNDEFLAPVRSIRNGILAMGSIMLGVSVAMVLFFARGVSKPITRVAQGLGDGAEQVASASSQVSSASQQLAEGASEQAAAIEETSSSLEEMSSMIRQNAENAGNANRLMEDVKRIVDRASSSMVRLTGSMQEISSASEDTQKIIRTIDEIAFQTNLLALNAAVEAARAGEAGAGFAVVADEVRNLAMRAADAAKNTAGLIEATVKRVKEGAESVTTTSQEFKEIVVSVNKSGDLVSEIAAASSEQAQGIEQISRAVSEMEKVVQQNSATAEESAAAAEEMNAQAEQMKAHVAGLTAIVGMEKAAGSRLKMPFSSKRSGTQTSLTPVLAGEGVSHSPVSSAKANGNGASKHPRNGTLQKMRPEDLIPFEGEDF